MVTKVEHSYDVGMGAEAAHGLGLAGDARPGSLIKTLGLDEGEGHLPVQQGVLGQVDLLLAALPQETLNLVAAVGEGGGLVWSFSGNRSRRGSSRVNGC